MSVTTAPALTLQDAVKDRSRIEAEGCWVWQGARSRDGYGRMYAPTIGQQLAHRISYIVFVGPIPDGLTIDHLCRNRACVNPSHLEPVTHRENTMRGNTLPARQAAQTHCKRGHEFNEENTYRHPSDGRRECRTCRLDNQRRRLAA